jgi:hypothetical protein
MTRDPRIDAYIAGRAEFARPILDHLRAAVHAACPDAEEGIEWGMPAFLVGGRILANMAAFMPGELRAAIGREPRARRIARAVEWLAEGKKRTWKYEKC